MSITQELSAEVAAVEFDDLPSAAVQRVKEALMDDVGIAFMAFGLLDQALVRFAAEVGGIPEATIIGAGTRVSAGLAAGVNAEMASHSDFEESGPGIHAFSPIGQTALAIGERVGASGKDVITAMAVSYEINGRLARNLLDETALIHLFPAHFRRHLVLNPAICAAKLLGLTSTGINQTIGLAWTMVPPDMRYIYLTPQLRWPNSQHNLWSCQLGVQAALLAKSGFGGPPDIIDHAGIEIYVLDSLLASPEPYYYVTRELNFKPWIGSYGFMGGMELAGKIAREHGLQASDIEAVIFRGSSVYSDPESMFVNTEPKDSWDALASVPWGIANVVLGHEPGPDWLDPATLDDPDRRALAKRVRLEAAESPYVNEVEIATTSSSYHERIRREDYLGTPARPLDQGQLEAKFLRTAGTVVSDRNASAMVELFNRLEDLEDLRELTEHFSA